MPSQAARTLRRRRRGVLNPLPLPRAPTPTAPVRRRRAWGLINPSAPRPPCSAPPPRCRRTSATGSPTMTGQCEKSTHGRSGINREIRYETTWDTTMGWVGPAAGKIETMALASCRAHHSDEIPGFAVDDAFSAFNPHSSSPCTWLASVSDSPMCWKKMSHVGRRDAVSVPHCEHRPAAENDVPSRDHLSDLRTEEDGVVVSAAWHPSRMPRR